MSRCGFSSTRPDDSLGLSFQFSFYILEDWVSEFGFATPAFVYFRSEFCLGIWFCGNLSSLFPPNNKDRKQNSGNHAVNKQASKRRRRIIILKSIVWTEQEEEKICENEKWKEENWENPLRKAPAEKRLKPSEGKFSWNFVYYTCTDEQRSSHRKNYILEVSKQRINQKVNK